MPDAGGFDPGRRRLPPKNVLGETLTECCAKPLTGFYRDGACNTGPEDVGVHTVCTRVDEDFLAFSKAAGNDLSTPVPQFGFAGLKPGDCWCLCAALEGSVRRRPCTAHPSRRDASGDARHRAARYSEETRDRYKLKAKPLPHTPRKSG